MTPQEREERPLLVTLTNEPVQPVRLYFAIPGRAFVLQRLNALDCVMTAPQEHCWHWLYHAEAAGLRFSAGGYESIPAHRRPIILGRIRFPKRGSMTLETNSIDRAVEGARFFAPRLGPKVVAKRCRVVNRCFTADDGSLPQVMRALNQNVTVIDPRKAEAELDRVLEGARSPQEAERALNAYMKERAKRDVPLVEDFPLCPEEETPEFQHLATTLMFRFIRAVEHWRGNVHLTLTEIITRTVEEHGPG